MRYRLQGHATKTTTLEQDARDVVEVYRLWQGGMDLKDALRKVVGEEQYKTLHAQLAKLKYELRRSRSGWHVGVSSLRNLNVRMSRLLADLPRFSEASWDCCFTAQALPKSARAMAGATAGLDQWSVEAWLCLLEPFWATLAKLWTAVLHSGVVWCMSDGVKATLCFCPKRWGFGLLLSFSCAWRVGARVLAWSLRPWVASWAGHQTLGGIFRRGVKDAFLRIFASLQDDFFYVQEDVSKFFDTIRLPHLLMTLDHLGAPPQFRHLVAIYYQNHTGVFSNV